MSIKALTSENEKLKSKNKNQCDYIKVLETSNKTAKEATDELRKNLSDTKVKFENEKAEHRKRIKSLKKVINEKL